MGTKHWPSRSAACYGTTPQVLFARWDKDGGETLDYAEMKRFMRAGLKISKADVSDDEIDVLIRALDDDASGSVGIGEL